jgi:hypothetical protein
MCSSCEVALRRRVEGLVFEEQHVTHRQGLAQALRRAIGERSRQVEPRYKAAYRRREGSDDEIRRSRHDFTFFALWRCEAQRRPRTLRMILR